MKEFYDYHIEISVDFWLTIQTLFFKKKCYTYLVVGQKSLAPCKKLKLKSGPSNYKMEPDLREGSALLSFMWFEVAKKIVQKAIHIYECTPEQAEALKKVFLRSNDYRVEAI